ncbi:MAG TPA: hypothetical protein VF472_04650 [Burkholderiaceae bacterium]
MHFEPPEKVIHTLKEFASHYAMIVISILTALALEHIAVSWHHANEARRAKEEIEREIAENRENFAGAIEATAAREKIWGDLLQKSVEQAKSGKATTDEQVELLQSAMDHYGDNTPPIKTSAWDAAIADQSVNYLGHADLERYSQLYALLHMQYQALLANLNPAGATQNASDIALALRLRKPDPAQTTRLLNWRVWLMHVVHSNLRQMKTALDEAEQGKDAAK